MCTTCTVLVQLRYVRVVTEGAADVAFQCYTIQCAYPVEGGKGRGDVKEGRGGGSVKEGRGGGC